MHEAKAAVPKGGVFRLNAGGAHLKPRAAAGISATATINPCRGTSLRCRTTGQTRLSIFSPSHRRPPFWDATIFALMTRSKTVDPRTGPSPREGLSLVPPERCSPFSKGTTQPHRRQLSWPFGPRTLPRFGKGCDSTPPLLHTPMSQASARHRRCAPCPPRKLPSQSPNQKPMITQHQAHAAAENN